MRKLLLLIALLLVSSLLLAFASCGGDEYDQLTRSISDDEASFAKDRAKNQPCDEFDLKLADCYDACNCCVFERDNENDTEHTNLDQCIWYCDGLLLKIEEVQDQSKADIDNYKECVVGCFSICDKPNKDVTCYQECAHYLGE